MAKQTVYLPPFHKNQQIVYDDPARFKVLVAGRRFGKSWLARMLCLDRAINHGETVWWISPTYNNVMTHWRATVAMVGDLPTYRNIQSKYLEFHIGGRRGSLAFKSGDRPDNLRGEGLDLAVLDEAAFIDEEVWSAVIRPALSDKVGKALIISTPNGTGDWFHNSYIRGLDDPTGTWKSFNFPTTANLSIPGIATEVKDAKRDLSDLRFRQEYIAEFVDYSGGIFFGLQEAALAEWRDIPEHTGSYIAGIDLGRKNDFTVVSILDTSKDPVEQVHIERFTEVGFNIQLGRIKTIIDQWGIDKTYMESNSFAMPLVEDLQNAGYSVTPVYVTSGNKTDIIDSLSANMQRGKLRILNTANRLGAIQMSELQAYEMKRSATGHVSYGAKNGWHDDTVMSLALANRGLRFSSIRLVSSTNPFY